MNKYPTKDSNRDKRQRTQLTYINYNIRNPTVRIISDNGEAPRIMNTKDAIALAESMDLDLVEISFDKASRIPVCKILDYNKFKYEQSKREKNARKMARANAVEVKTIQFSITTDDADKQRLIKQAKEFLAEGDKVKISIRFRNRREGQNLDFAKGVMRELLTNFDGLATLDTTPALGGREMFCILRKI